MLTSEQYEAVGRLAVSFNEIDWITEVYIANVLNTPEWSQSVYLAEREISFDRKKTLLRKLLDNAEKEYPQLEHYIEVARRLLATSSEISSKRNEHVHGLVVRNGLSKKVMRRYKGTEKPCDAAAINALAIEASALAEALNDACSDVVMRLIKFRDKKRSKQDEADSL